MNTTLKAILSDLDGTLAETESLNAAAYGAALRSHGYPVADSLVLATVNGRRYDAFLPELAPGIDAAAMKKVADRKKELYRSLIPGARLNRPLLEWLVWCSGKVALGLVTTASRAAVGAFLGRADWPLPFDVVITGDDVIKGKPDPEAYLLAAKRLGVTARECLVLEDSENGLLAAQRFGAQTMQVRGFPAWPDEPFGNPSGRTHFLRPEKVREPLSGARPRTGVSHAVDTR